MPLKKRRYILVTLLMLFVSVYLQPTVVHANPDASETEVSEEEDTRLALLNINDAPLMPGLSDNVSAYTVILPKGTTYVNISTQTESYLSWTEGTGDFYLNGDEESTDFKITVYASDGSSREYTIHVLFNDGPNLLTTLNNETLGFVTSNLNNLNVPEGFKKKKGSYQGNSITVFSNEAYPFSLVYLENSTKKADWYCYQDGAVTSVFRSLVINKNKYYYAGIDEDKQSQKGYTFKELNVVGEKLNGWTVNDERYASKIMLYLYDSQGKADYYVYDTDNQTLVNRVELEVGFSKNEKAFWQSPLFIAVAIVIVIAIAFASIALNANHKRSLKERKAKAPGAPKEKVELDHTVELVRTSKVRIYASNDELSSPRAEKEELPEQNIILEVEEEKPSKPEQVNLEIEEVMMDEDKAVALVEEIGEAIISVENESSREEEPLLTQTTDEKAEALEMVSEKSENQPAEPLPLDTPQTPMTKKVYNNALAQIKNLREQLEKMQKSAKKADEADVVEKTKTNEVVHIKVEVDKQPPKKSFKEITGEKQVAFKHFVNDKQKALKGFIDEKKKAFEEKQKLSEEKKAQEKQKQLEAKKEKEKLAQEVVPELKVEQKVEDTAESIENYMDDIPMIDDEASMFEIQEYIDNLFYSNQKKN